MPARRRGSNLGRRTAGAIQRRNLRAQRTDVQIQQENEVVRVNMSQLRASQSQDDRAERNEERRLQQRQARRYVVEARRENDIRRQQVHRAFISHTFRRLAFEYEPDVKYFDHSKVAIGDMDNECAICKALKFKNEPAGMCCATGLGLLAMEPPNKKSKLSWENISKEGLDLDFNPNFLSKKEADRLLDWFEKNVEYFSGDLAQVKVFGRWHKIPRKQVSYGEEGLSYKFSGNTVPALPWPDELASLRERLNEVTSNKFNFVLVNRYKDGNDHMGYHRDDEGDLDQTAPIASISLGQTRDFVFQHADARRSGAAKRGIPPVKISLTHGSLLMMNPPTNQRWYHALPKRKNCPGVRINLTFRTMIVKPKR